MSSDIIKFKKLTEQCKRNEPAYCESLCPLSLDIKAFLKKIQNNKFNSAYKLYQNTVLFPQIVSFICDAPCRDMCMRNAFGGSINIKKIEQACSIYSDKKESSGYYIPVKNKNIAVIGGGLSGMGCAMKLSKRGYRVHLYEKNSVLGGRLWEQLSAYFTKDVLEEELNALYNQEFLEIFLKKEVEKLNDLKLKYDAVYVATGTEGNKFGLKLFFDKNSLASDCEGVFISCAEGLSGSPIEALKEGILAANEIEAFLKVGRMEMQKDIYEKKPTELEAVLNQADFKEANQYDENTLFTKTDAIEEAQRCFLCSCSACIDNCEMLSKYKKYPEKVIEDINATLNVMEGYTVRIASRQINSCNLCGSCVNKCPTGFDFEKLFLESRRLMHKAGDIPPAYHDFWMRDMEHALSAHAYTFLKNGEKSDYLFFPGCQLGASDSDYIVKAYDFLESHLHNVGVLLSCCGAPAYWAGDYEKFEEIMEFNKKQWINMGEPEIILSCPHCGKLIKKYLKGCRIKSIYEIMSSYRIEGISFYDKTYSVFDPCASREFKEMQNSVRQIILSLEGEVEELEKSGIDAQCCGYGGHIHAVDKGLMDGIVERRITGSSKDYITYCINCRDIFASKGKRVLHVLDLLLLTDENSLESRTERKVPDLSQRRRNREEAKRKMDLRFGRSDSIVAKERIKLDIDEALLDKMNKELILKEDVQNVIEACEKSNCKLLDIKTGNYIGHMQSRYITYWVEYKVAEDRFQLINIYSHRMNIQEEYNGRIEDR